MPRATGSDDEASRGDGRRRGRAPRFGRRPGVRRMIAGAALLPLASRAPLYARLLWALMLDSRTPAGRKALLASALGYIVIGRDIVPDRIPVLGQLDDLVVTALATELFLDGLDESLLAEKLAEVGIPRAAYEEDVARLRRLVPSPIRRVGKRLPGAVRFVVSSIPQRTIRQELRRWLATRGQSTKAGRPALMEGSSA